METDPKINRLPIQRGLQLNVTVDGQLVEAYVGETVAAVLLAAGYLQYRHTSQDHTPKNYFCGMGVCFNCLVSINGIPNLRACVTFVNDGMVIETGREANE
jgi:predicted molibdopterin-dependent oxidoreductase YjgC